MSLFSTVDKDSGSLIIESHYYAWLLASGKKDIHYVDTKIEYLETQGFVRGVDKITWGSLKILQAIEERFFYWVILGNVA